MVFSSPIFLFLFLPATLFLYWGTISFSRITAKNVLIASSLFFYGWWDIAFVPLILSSTFINYAIGQSLQFVKSRFLLAVGVILNLALLAIYKYTDLAISTFNYLSEHDVELLQITLPLAISFFTFQQIAYLVDSYQDKVQNDTPQNYFLFVLFFPQLIAGPIVHHSEMMPQYQSLKRLKDMTSKYFVHALILIFVGLFKKTVIADNLAHWADPAFSAPEALTLLDAWTGLVAYSFQIYFDFSAYSEIAMGVALLFGIKIPINFNSPYQSSSITEFWRRWHITLGRFLKQYLYIQLGGNRNGSVSAIYAVSTTMLLGGLWHGAGWQFVLWGGLHGLFLSTAFIWRKTGIAIHKTIAVCLTFISVVIAWVPFRSESIQDALTYWHAMFDVQNFHWQPLHASLLSPFFGNELSSTSSYFNGWELGMLSIITIAVMQYKNVHEYLEEFNPTIKNYALISTFSMVALAIMGRPQTFIYYGF